MDLKLLADDGNRVFGKGIYWLLKNIDELGSIKKSCEKMNMSYSKGNRIIVNAEKEMGVNLLIRYKGGKEKGGATLTETAKKIIDTFEKTKVKLNDLAKNNILKDFIKLLSDLNVMINK